MECIIRSGAITTDLDDLHQYDQVWRVQGHLVLIACPFHVITLFFVSSTAVAALVYNCKLKNLIYMENC